MTDVPIVRDSSVVPTRYWHRLEDGRVQCDLCPRFCRLAEGQRGLCFVRGRDDGEVVLTTYGRSSGFCVDPIEKKPLNHFLPGTPVLSFGTAGCNLACKFCQNWDITKSREIDTLADAASPGDDRARRRSSSAAAASPSPTTIRSSSSSTRSTSPGACREVGIKTVAVTAGEICPRAAGRVLPRIDAANVDLKAFTERFYRELCGADSSPCSTRSST